MVRFGSVHEILSHACETAQKSVISRQILNTWQLGQYTLNIGL